jgi:formylmethanofuran dehydrogenase subunit C
MREANTGTWHMIYTNTAAPVACPLKGLLELNFTKTTYNVDAIRIAMNTAAVPGWNELDAIELQSNLPPGAKFSVQTGNWNNTSTWAGGVIPGAADTVVIGNGHNITVNGNFSVKSLFVNSGGTLTFNAANTLTLGPAGGGKEYLQVQGNLNMSNGTLAVNGNIEFQAGSSFTMSGGQIIVDGNDGTAGGSVANGIDLFALKPSIALCSVTGGTITIVDPQYNASGQAISGNYVLGAAMTLKLGDGSSTTTGNNPNGFGGAAFYPNIGNLVIDAVTTTGNRHFNNGNILNVAGTCIITSGKFEPLASVNITGNLVNNGTLNKTGGNFSIGGDLINNGSITVTGGSFSVFNDFTNNAGKTYNVTDGSYTSIGDDLVNDGSFTCGWLYMAYNFGTSTNAQTIGGSGTFTVYGDRGSQYQCKQCNTPGSDDGSIFIFCRYWGEDLYWQ